jgi:hypothetical protein
VADESLTPVERLRVSLILEGHEEDAEAFALVDSLMRNYLTDEPMTKDAEELRDMLFEVLDTWNAINLN